ncbi:Flp pilus assembly protein CpaB [Actinospongicola halichondriae]|uniref:Flp pilus assembly protein CpaB n=1 Tax=Actinospongicola halichondriae TaxID=3236844 RepID=UPI003D4352B2
MSSRRWVILAVAVLLGIVAGGLVYNYVQGVEDDVNEEARRVEVYKVVTNVPKGTFAEDAFANGWIEKSEIAAEFRPGTAINDPADIAGQVAISDLAANQVVVTQQFASQSSQLSTFSTLLQQNQVAITISVDQVRGVAGLLVPGDFVNVLLTDGASNLGGEEDGVDAEGNPVDTGNGTIAPDARYLYQKVQILAIGQQRELQPGETVSTNPDGSPVVQSTGLLTLAVPVDAAQWIASASTGQLYLTLVAKDYTPVPVGPIAPSPSLPAENPDQLTPYGPDGQSTP